MDVGLYFISELLIEQRDLVFEPCLSSEYFIDLYSITRMHSSLSPLYA